MHISKYLFPTLLILSTVSSIFLVSPPKGSTQTLSTPGSVAIASRDEVKTILISLMLLLVFIFFLVCMISYFLIKDPVKIKFAEDSMRLAVGFFIGAITGWLG